MNKKSLNKIRTLWTKGTEPKHVLHDVQYNMSCSNKLIL